jgi:exodeoxyribonuclease VII large subunit
MKQGKSQWQFTELFPTEAIRKVLTVTELTGAIRRTLENEFPELWVTGEISNLKIQSSGHVYFSLKDAGAQLSCVLFRNEAVAVNREYLQDGQKVVLHGEVTVYETRGQYQLRVLNVELRGLGALQAAFEKLKQKLQAEGLFAQERKRVLPRFAQRIGLVTSPSGAAIRDVLHVIERRNPALELVLAPCRVQGAGAAQEVAWAVQLLNEWSQKTRTQLDLILVTRGGGSLEDLWAFNEEIVARAIFHSAIPVISAVGHEIDFTISDFVADFRAATPSAAAEIITEGIFASRQFISQVRVHLAELLDERINWKEDELRALRQRLNRLHPQRRINDYLQRIDDSLASINRCARFHWREKAARSQNLLTRLIRTRPDAVVQRRREHLTELSQALQAATAFALQEKRNHLRNTLTTLRLLSPLNVLERGYSITMDATTKKVLRDSTTVQPGAELISKVAKGEIHSVVKENENSS